MRENAILMTDSYKLCHAEMLSSDTTGVFSYLESRGGAYPATLFFGLQYYLRRYLEGARVTYADIAEAEEFCKVHFSHARLNTAGWQRIVDVHGGRLPVRICAAPEGSVVPTHNALMTIENTDPQLPWLTNAIESLLLKVWYPTTVATRSFFLRAKLDALVKETGGESAAYQLQDFGYRGASSEETAVIGGASHLLSFRGSDTVPCIRWAREYYGAPLSIGSSVPASEHSIMTAQGRDGEIATALQIIAANEGSIVSLVADSYDYYRFVRQMCLEADIVKRAHVKLVIRPDSVTPDHPTPESLVLWTLQEIADRLPSTKTSTGHKVLPYGVLWGDGIEEDGILKIAMAARDAGFAVQNLVFGMGGGLLQKVNRDTCRFAIKCSAQRDAHAWRPVMKDPLDASKRSKGGRLTLTNLNGVYKTQPEGGYPDAMRPVFENGVVLVQDTWKTIRARVDAALVEHERVAEPIAALQRA